MRKALGLAALSAGLGLAACGSSAASGGRTTPSATDRAAPVAGTVVRTIKGMGAVKAGDYDGVAADATSVWVYNGDSGVLTRVDKASGRVVATVKLKPGCSSGLGCGNLAVGEGAVWVANVGDGTVTRVDPAGNTVAAVIPTGRGAQVFATPGNIWSANYLADSYTRIDPRSNRSTTLAGHPRPEEVADQAGSVWLCDSGGNPALTRLDAGTMAVQARVSLGAGGASATCLSVAPLGSRLYVLAAGDAGASPLIIDPAGNTTTPAVDPAASRLVERGVVGGADGTWLIDAQRGLLRLDPRTGAPMATLPLANPAGIADDGRSIWVATGDGSLLEITPAA